RDEMRAEALPLQCHAVFGDAVPALTHLVQQREERAVRRQQLGQRAPGEGGGGAVEELLGGEVEVAEAVARIQDEDRLRQRRQDGAAVRHQAASGKASKTCGSTASTRSGSS